MPLAWPRALTGWLLLIVKAKRICALQPHQKDFETVLATVCTIYCYASSSHKFRIRKIRSEVRCSNNITSPVLATQSTLTHDVIFVTQLMA
ncbi:hypothetical protein V1507DRAFT_458357 [Lipomyces tetrasporus]